MVDRLSRLCQSEVMSSVPERRGKAFASPPSAVCREALGQADAVRVSNSSRRLCALMLSAPTGAKMASANGHKATDPGEPGRQFHSVILFPFSHMAGCSAFSGPLSSTRKREILQPSGHSRCHCNEDHQTDRRSARESVGWETQRCGHWSGCFENRTRHGHAGEEPSGWIGDSPGPMPGHPGT